MDSRIAILRRVGFCGQLPDAPIQALAAIAVPLRYPQGAMIQLEGDPGEAMYVVDQGRVKISRLAAGGREQVLAVVGPGQHLNTVVVFDGGRCPANAESMTDVTLLALPSAAMRSVIAEHADLALALMRELSGRLRHMVNLVDDLALHTVQGRLAGLLLTQAEAAEQGEHPVALTQAEMAARLGTVREMIARTLRGFEIQGLVRLERGTITIQDREGLRQQREG